MRQTRLGPRSGMNATVITAGMSGSKRNSAHTGNGVYSSSIWSAKGPTAHAADPLEVCSVSNRRPPDRGSGARHFA